MAALRLGLRTAQGRQSQRRSRIIRHIRYLPIGTDLSGLERFHRIASRRVQLAGPKIGIRAVANVQCVAASFAQLPGRQRARC